MEALVCLFRCPSSRRSVWLPLTAAGAPRPRLRRPRLLLLPPGWVPAGRELQPAPPPGPVAAPVAAWGEEVGGRRRRVGEEEG